MVGNYFFSINNPHLTVLSMYQSQYKALYSHFCYLIITSSMQGKILFIAYKRKLKIIEAKQFA